MKEKCVRINITSGSNCVNPVIATYFFYHKKARKRNDDGSIVIKVIKQYNNSPVGDYLK